MRILQLNSMLKGGGTDDQCVKLSHALHQLGQDAWIAGPAGRDFSKVVARLGIPWHATPPEGPAKIRLMFNAAKFVKQHRIEIVHGHHGRDIWPTILVARLAGTRPRIVLTRHMAKSPSGWPSRKFILSNVDSLVAVSEFVARVLRDGVYEPDSPEEERRARPPLIGDHSKMTVIHGGIDTGRFNPFDATRQREEWGLTPEHYAFAIAGSYDLPRGKGQREYLQAAAAIHKRIPNARFLIIGRGNMGDILRQDIERLGLRGTAWLTPYSHDMPQAMNAIDCLVHSQVGTEAFGLVLVEAFSCGRPVIASALDGIPEAFAVTSHGQLVTPESVTELSAAMLDWAARPRLSLAERLAMHEKVSRNYSVLAYGKRMLALYEKLMSTQKPH